MPLLHTLPLLCFLLCFSSPSTAQQQTRLLTFNISQSPWFPTQKRILVSANSTFAAGFRLSPTSPNRYFFAIWYLNISLDTIVWSVSQDSPFDTTTSLQISPQSGLLSLNSSAGTNLWPQLASGSPPNSSQLILSGIGELIFGNWSSFKFPTDTALPLQLIFGTTLISNNRKYAFQGSNNLVFNSSSVYWSINNKIVRLETDGALTKDDGSSFIPQDVAEETHPLRRFNLGDDGNLRIYSFNQGLNRWVVVWAAIQEPCLIHGTCGPNYICISGPTPNSTQCTCPPGFHIVKQSTNTNNGGTPSCELKIPSIEDHPKYLQFDYVNYSGGSNQTDRQSPNLSTCQSDCSSNPRCLGFGFRFDGKKYCVHQIDRLLNGYWSPGTETAMFIKVSKTETDVSNFTGLTSKLETTCPIRIKLANPPSDSNSTRRNLSIICALFVVEVVSGAMAFYALLKKYIKYRDMAQSVGVELVQAGGPKRFSYEELKVATKDFSDVVGHGGFGVVYKGTLPDGRLVAVKRLKSFGFGAGNKGNETQFWAEVTIIARMHHLNLVRMWGFCADKSQRLLVYEYIPNGSLDKFLFSPKTPPIDTTTPLLDLKMRYRISLGVARAIAYLHEECLEWVLHCDIKPENILLENDFCPKVSDFGLAKLAKKEDMVSMSRMRGTRGYMAPEWVRMEPITAKADVYSYGMVLLEMVSGVRSMEFKSGEGVESEEWYFPRWVYEKVYEEGRVEEIVDRRMFDGIGDEEMGMVDRMVKTAMWCLEDRAEMRPSMGRVAKMLEGSVEIAEPGKPTIFYLGSE